MTRSRGLAVLAPSIRPFVFQSRERYTASLVESLAAVQAKGLAGPESVCVAPPSAAIGLLFADEWPWVCRSQNSSVAAWRMTLERPWMAAAAMLTDDRLRFSWLAEHLARKKAGRARDIALEAHRSIAAQFSVAMAGFHAVVEDGAVRAAAHLVGPEGEVQESKGLAGPLQWTPWAFAGGEAFAILDSVWGRVGVTLEASDSELPPADAWVLPEGRKGDQAWATFGAKGRLFELAGPSAPTSFSQEADSAFRAEGFAWLRIA